MCIPYTGSATSESHTLPEEQTGRRTEPPLASGSRGIDGVVASTSLPVAGRAGHFFVTSGNMASTWEPEGGREWGGGNSTVFPEISACVFLTWDRNPKPFSMKNPCKATALLILSGPYGICGHWRTVLLRPCHVLAIFLFSCFCRARGEISIDDSSSSYSLFPSWFASCTLCLHVFFSFSNPPFVYQSFPVRPLLAWTREIKLP